MRLVATYPNDMAETPVLADFDQDGILDLLVRTTGDAGSTESTETISLLGGRGDGTFVARNSFPTSFLQPFDAVAADLNHDQIPDIISKGPLGSFVVRLGQGDGSFAEERTIPGVSSPSEFDSSTILVADFDKDGSLDVAIASQPNQFASVLRGHGDGTFFDQQDYSISGFPSGVTIQVHPPEFGKFLLTDWNADGIPDLVAANNYLHLLLGTGGGHFSDALHCSIEVSLTSEGSFPSLVVSDFDDDGRTDIATKDGALFGMNGCNFAKAIKFDVPNGQAAPIAAGDFNGDGAKDLVLSTWDGLELLIADGKGAFGQTVMLVPFPDWNSSDTKAITGDLDGDGRLDLIVVDAWATRVFLNTCQ